MSKYCPLSYLSLLSFFSSFFQMPCLQMNANSLVENQTQSSGFYQEYKRVKKRRMRDRGRDRHKDRERQRERQRKGKVDQKLKKSDREQEEENAPSHDFYSNYYCKSEQRN